MTHGSTCFRAGKSCSARIRKQVQYIYLASGTAYLIRHKVPVYSLFREESGMLEAGGADIEFQAAVVYRPRLRELPAEFPLSAALFGTVVVTVGVFPQRIEPVSLPYYLRIRSDEAYIAPFFELFAVRGIEYRIILPVFSCSQDKFSLMWLSSSGYGTLT